MFNDFLGELIAEDTRTGQMRKPNARNPISLSRKKLLNRINSQARELGKEKPLVALEYVQQQLPDIQRYVVSKGEQPLQNPAELSLQAYVLRKRDIDSVAKALGKSAKEAEEYLEEAESNAASVNSSEADNFLGGLFAAIGSVASKAAAQVRDNRVAKGKKPGIWGALAQDADQQAVMYQQAGIPNQSGIGVFASDVFNAIKEQEKKKEIQKMLPMIIIGIVVLILITVLITRNAKSK